jgi:hypothetical protein
MPGTRPLDTRPFDRLAGSVTKVFSDRGAAGRQGGPTQGSVDLRQPAADTSASTGRPMLAVIGAVGQAETRTTASWSRGQQTPRRCAVPGNLPAHDFALKRSHRGRLARSDRERRLPDRFRRSTPLGCHCPAIMRLCATMRPSGPRVTANQRDSQPQAKC